MARVVIRAREAITGGALILAACGAPPPTTGTAPATASTAPAASRGDGTDSMTTLLPAGYGSLRQDDIAIQVRLPQILVRALPLDEGIIRLLSPDSYRALHELREGQRTAVARDAERLGVSRPSLWYLSFFGLQPDARFTARDVTVSSGGRDYRPLDVIPLSAGFGGGLVGQREVQSAIYVFPSAVDPSQPLTLAVESVPGTSWSSIIPVIERERAFIRSRVSGRP